MQAGFIITNIVSSTLAKESAPWIADFR